MDPVIKLPGEGPSSLPRPSHTLGLVTVTFHPEDFKSCGLDLDEEGEPMEPFVLGEMGTRTQGKLADVKVEVVESDDDISIVHEGGVIQAQGDSTAPVHQKKTSFQLFGPFVVKHLQDATSAVYQNVRYYQREAVLKTLEKVEGDGKNKPLLICAPPGAGKSGIMAMLAYALQPKKVLILTPSQMLSQQLGETFGYIKGKSFFHTCGFIEALHPKDQGDFLEFVTIVGEKLDPLINFTNIVIINAQKFAGKCGTSLSLQYGDKDMMENVRELFKEFDLLLVDEAQHYPADTWKKIVDEFYASGFKGQRKQVIFFTATAERGDKTPILGEDRLAYSIELSELEGKQIRKLKFVEKPSRGDLKFTKLATFTNVRADISNYLNRQKEAEPGFNPQAMIIVRTTKEAKRWAEKLNGKGKGSNPSFAVAIIGDHQGQKFTKEFTEGKFKVAVICNLLKEGYSNSKVTLCVILRNIRSRVLFDQFIGRAMRLNQDVEGIDKSVGIILSYENFGQKEMWENRLKLAELDPVDDDDVEGEESSAPKYKSKRPVPVVEDGGRPKRARRSCRK